MAATTVKNAMLQGRHVARTPVASTVACAAFLLSSHAYAAEWKFQPNLTLGATYTDNVRLTAAGTETSDFITQVSPGFVVTGAGRGLKLNASYTMQNLLYEKATSKVLTNHLLAANANAELVRDLFFLDAKAGISQQNISPFAAQSSSNLNLSDNRTEVRTTSISPYLQHRFGSAATAELRYAHDSVDTSTGGLQDTDQDRLLVNVNSGPAYRSVGWGLRYSHQTIHYKNANSVDLDEVSGALHYLISPRLSLDLTIGHEKNGYAAIGKDPEGFFWLAGATWTPSERTSLKAGAGKRFYGNTYSLAANHRSRQTIWSVGYSEDITTTQSQFVVPATIDTADLLNQLLKPRIPNDQARQQAVDDFLRNTNLPASSTQAINTVTNRFFLQKNLQASVVIDGVKNTLVFNVFRQDREAQSSGTVDSPFLAGTSVALQDHTRQKGANVLWNWRISPRSSANLTLGTTQAESLSTGLKTDTQTVRAGFARQLQPHLKALLEYRHLHQESNQTAADIRENAFMASLLMTF